MTTPAPLASRIRAERRRPGDTFTDDYAWLADRDNPDVTAYLAAENAYTDDVTARLAGLREHDLRRDQGAYPGNRPVGTGPQGRLVVLHQDGRGEAVPDSLPAGGPRRTR